MDCLRYCLCGFNNYSRTIYVTVCVYLTIIHGLSTLLLVWIYHYLLICSILIWSSIAYCFFNLHETYSAIYRKLLILRKYLFVFYCGLFCSIFDFPNSVVDHCMSFCPYFFWLLYCLSFDLRLLITPLVSSSSSVGLSLWLL